MAWRRPAVIFLAFAGLFIALYGGPLLRHAGLSLPATDAIQLACGAMTGFIAVHEIRVQLARERAAGVPEPRFTKILAIALTTAAVVGWLVLTIGKNR